MASRRSYSKLILCSAATLAVVLGLLSVFQRRIVAWLFGTVVIYKTQITLHDQERLKSLLGMKLPADAPIGWAMYFHAFRGEIHLAFRIQLPLPEAAELRRCVESSAVRDSEFDLRLLLPDTEEGDSLPTVDAAFFVNSADVDWIAFCNSNDGRVPVYFSIDGWPYRDLHGIEDVFLTRR